MRIRYVIDTHLHADHVSVGRALAKAAGAEYDVGADVAYPFYGVRDGDTLELGNVTIVVLHTPGHTPEHISLLVTDRTRSQDPWFVLTGHTLMVRGSRPHRACDERGGRRARLVWQRATAQGTARLFRSSAGGLFGLGVRTQLEWQACIHHRL